MIIASLDDAAQAIGVLERRVQQLTAEIRALQAAAADPDAIVKAFDELVERQLAGLEAAVAADLAFEDEDQAAPVRAVRSARP